MIDVIILYILNRYDSSIYRIKKIADEFFFAYTKTSIGTINPALKRLHNSGCVEFRETMSDGGMKTKTYSITPTGKKHLVTLLLAFDSKNPYKILNDIKIALYCSDVLSINETLEFKENLRNYLDLYKIQLERGLKNEYITLNELQKNTVKITLKEVEELINTL